MIADETLVVIGYRQRIDKGAVIERRNVLSVTARRSFPGFTPGLWRVVFACYDGTLERSFHGHPTAVLAVLSALGWPVAR